MATALVLAAHASESNTRREAAPVCLDTRFQVYTTTKASIALPGILCWAASPQQGLGGEARWCYLLLQLAGKVLAMKLGLRSIGLIVGFLACSASSTHAQMNVVVEATTKEQVGGRLAFALKERIRASSGYKLVGTLEDALFRLSLVTLDDKSGYSTTYSIVFSAWQPQTGTWTYLHNIVGTCGTSRLSECADGLVADADQVAELPKAFYKSYYKNDTKK
jgi:hypothetical protein